MKRDDLYDLAAFAVVAKHRSFTRAAANSRMSQSALSHAMKALEERLGVRLLSRTTRSVATTDAGETLLRSLRPALDDIAVERGRGRRHAWQAVGHRPHHGDQACDLIRRHADPAALSGGPPRYPGGYARRRQPDRHRCGTPRRRHPLRGHRREGYDRGAHRTGHPHVRRGRTCIFL